MITDPAVSEQGLLLWTSQFHEAIVLPSLITQRALTNLWGAGGQPRRLNLTDVRGHQAGQRGVQLRNGAAPSPAPAHGTAAGLRQPPAWGSGSLGVSSLNRPLMPEPSSQEGEGCGQSSVFLGSETVSTAARAAWDRKGTASRLRKGFRLGSALRGAGGGVPSDL